MPCRMARIAQCHQVRHFRPKPQTLVRVLGVMRLQVPPVDDAPLEAVLTRPQVAHLAQPAQDVPTGRLEVFTILLLSFAA